MRPELSQPVTPGGADTRSLSLSFSPLELTLSRARSLSLSLCPAAGVRTDRNEPLRAKGRFQLAEPGREREREPSNFCWITQLNVLRLLDHGYVCIYHTPASSRPAAGYYRRGFSLPPSTMSARCARISRILGRAPIVWLGSWIFG